MWFLYFVGPFLTLFLLTASNLIAWFVVLVTSPYQGVATAQAKLKRLPEDARAWWDNYVWEFRRDRRALWTWISDKSTLVLSAICSAEVKTVTCCDQGARDDSIEEGRGGYGSLASS